jgi:hypothetical protein
MPKKSPPVISSVSISPQSGPGGTTFSATVAASGFQPLKFFYHWKIDGVEIVGATGATHVASKAGFLAVVVRAVNKEGEDRRESSAVQVTPALAAASVTSVSVSPSFGEVGELFTAVVEASGVPLPTLSYQWLMNGAELAGATAFSYAARTKGDLSVRVTATNTGGGDSLESATVAVVPISTDPAISAVSITPSAGRVGDTFAVNATAAGDPAPVLGYQWTLDGVAIGGATAQSHTAGRGGSLAVLVTASNSVGSVSAAATAVLVEPALSVPVISQVSIAPASGHVGDVFTATASVAGNPTPTVSYQWTLDGMAIGGATQPTYMAGAEGTLAVVVTAINSQGSDSETAPGVPVDLALTGPTFWNASISPASGHVGDVFTASATVTGNPPPSLSYQWTLNGTAVDCATAASFTAAAEGTLAVVITASNSEGTETATSPAVLVKAALAAPTISAAIISPTSGHVGELFTASASVAGNPTPNVSFQWMLDGVAVEGATAKSFTAGAEGALAVVVTAANSVGSATTTAPNALVRPALQAPVISGASIAPTAGRVGDVFTASATATGNPVPVLSYQWILDGTAIAEATAVSYTAEAAGSLVVAVTAANSEGASSSTSAAVEALPRDETIIRAADGAILIENLVSLTPLAATLRDGLISFNETVQQ